MARTFTSGDDDSGGGISDDWIGHLVETSNAASIERFGGRGPHRNSGALRFGARGCSSAAAQPPMKRPLSADCSGRCEAANGQYRHVLLTSAERDAPRWQLGSARCLFPPRAEGDGAGNPCGGGIDRHYAIVFTGSSAWWSSVRRWDSNGILFAALFLPVYTPFAGPRFPPCEMDAMLGMLLLAFGPDTLKWSWLLISCLWPLVGSNGREFRFAGNCPWRSGPSSCIFNPPQSI